MPNTFAIIGGDLRMIKLANCLAKDKNIVYTYGLEETEELKNVENIIVCKTLEQATKEAKTILGPIPFSKDGKYINTPFSKKKIMINDLISASKTKKLIAGSIKKDIVELAKKEKIQVIDIMEQEELTILNVIATAEGAIKVAIENTDKILHGSKVLIIGFGRIGKILSKKLEGLSCKVTCSARNKEDFAWIKSYGYEYLDTNLLGENLSQFDIIINTVPHLILDKERLEYIKKDGLLIDLASKPGGIDFKYAEEKNIKTIWALALPGKIAPETSAEFIKNVIGCHWGRSNLTIIVVRDGAFWQFLVKEL